MSLTAAARRLNFLKPVVAAYVVRPAYEREKKIHTQRMDITLKFLTLLKEKINNFKLEFVVQHNPIIYCFLNHEIRIAIIIFNF